MVHSWILIYIPPAVRQGLYISEAGNVIKLLWYFKNSNIFMPFLTLRKVRFHIRCCFCMVKYAKNINFCYWNESFLRKKMFILPTSSRKWPWQARIGLKTIAGFGRQMTFWITWYISMAPVVYIAWCVQ